MPFSDRRDTIGHKTYCKAAQDNLPGKQADLSVFARFLLFIWTVTDRSATMLTIKQSP
jgi:hypothetical protein